MTKEEVLEKLENCRWTDGKGNTSMAEGSIKSVWGYNKNNAVTIHKVHYTIDPYFKVPCGDTSPCLTICIQNGKMGIIPDAKLDSINYEDYIWLSEEDVGKTGKSITDLMAEI